MVALAVSGEPRLVCDAREMQRPGKSYTIDSLIELRGELGAQQGLCMVLGCDAVQDIADLAPLARAAGLGPYRHYRATGLAAAARRGGGAMA